MPKIGFSWEMIHQEILNQFCPEFSEQNVDDFMKLAVPEDIFNSLFIQEDGIYNEKTVAAVYAGAPEANCIYEEMRNLMICDKKPKGGAYTYERCPKLLAFQRKWEEWLPFSKYTAATHDDEEDHNRKQLREIIGGFMNDIDPGLSRVYEPLALLVDQKKYSTVLAILSVMATARTSIETEDPALCAVVLPALKGYKDERSYDMLCRSDLRVTWELLHNQVYKRLRDDGALDNISKFLPELIPDDLLKKLREGDESKNKTEKSEKNGKSVPKEKKDGDGGKYTGYVYLGKNGAAPKFRAARDHIIGKKSEGGESFTWDTAPVIAHFRQKWEKLIPATQYTAPECDSMEDPSVRKMKAVVDCLLDEIPSDRQNVAARLQGLAQSEPYSMVLAILSVIASTLFCFAMRAEDGVGYDDPSAVDEILYSVVLPPLPEKEASAALQKARKIFGDPGKSLEDLDRAVKELLKDPVEKGEACFLLYEKAMQEEKTAKAKELLYAAGNAGYPPAIIRLNEMKAEARLSEARSIFNGPYGIDSHQFLDTGCCTRCEEILQIPTQIPRTYRAEASYMLYKCISNGKYRPKTGETAEYYLEISHMNGHPGATEEWTSRNNSTIAPQPGRSESQTEGICCCNADNIFSETFAETVPDTWGATLIPYRPAELERAVFDPIPRRFLFLSDDFSKNLSDLFRTLQAVKQYAPKPEQLHWEFFVRHDSEAIHGLVDTALSRLSEYQLPVYIINDSKVAAQQLLSRHPLFYPVRALILDRINQTGDQRPLLHFVVIGNSSVTEWLVREAFWMMGFRNDVIRTRITVLAEKGEAFEVSLKGRFPGMSRDITQIDKIELPEIKGENVVLESARLQEMIQKYTGETDYCYFAVATDSDEGNLTLATRVREALIRTAIERREEARLHQMPPVAFLCRNREIAWLSKCMVVEKEEYGNSWFNTRALIPFGEVSDRYHFDRITGGTFELLAKCIHYQYSQLDPKAVLSGAPEALAAEKDYYLRQYNQDSSYSIALGFPYRLFQFKDGNGIQVTPTGWNILQNAPFTSVEQLHFMARRMKDSGDAEVRAISEWEHARWVRWMLSRGWRAATTEEAAFAYLSGNPRQQLFAAKMHPCICSYEAQRDLAKALEKHGLKKDFYSYDRKNVQATRQLLNLEWVVDRTENLEYDAKEMDR